MSNETPSCSCGSRGTMSCPRCHGPACPSHKPDQESRCAHCEAEYEKRFSRSWTVCAVMLFALFAGVLTQMSGELLAMGFLSTALLGVGLLLTLRTYSRTRFLAERFDEPTLN